MKVCNSRWILLFILLCQVLPNVESKVEGRRRRLRRQIRFTMPEMMPIRRNIQKLIGNDDDDEINKKNFYGFPYEETKRRKADAGVPIFNDLYEILQDAASATEMTGTRELDNKKEPEQIISYATDASTVAPAIMDIHLDPLHHQNIKDIKKEKDIGEREGFLEYDFFKGKAPPKAEVELNGEMLQSFDFEKYGAKGNTSLGRSNLGHPGSDGAIGRVAMDPNVFEQEKALLFTIVSTQPPTPHIDFSKAAILHYDQACTVYGEHINEVQWNTDPVSEKKKKLGGEETVEYFGTQICNFMQKRLECVPNGPRPQMTPPTRHNDGGGNDVDEDDQIVAFPKLAGKCKCLRALGEKASWWMEEESENYRCVIPADLGLHSRCGFDVHFPYGEILDSPNNFKRSFSAALACTEHSNCTTGYTYTGLRCHCNKGTHMNKLTPGKCVPDSRGSMARPQLVYILFLSITTNLNRLL